MGYRATPTLEPGIAFESPWHPERMSIYEMTVPVTLALTSPREVSSEEARRIAEQTLYTVLDKLLPIKGERSEVLSLLNVGGKPK